MIHDAMTGSCSGTPLDANGVEGEGEGSKKPHIRCLDEGQGEPKSAKKHQHQQVKVEEAQLHQLYEERKAELSVVMNIKLIEGQVNLAALYSSQYDNTILIVFKSQISGEKRESERDITLSDSHAKAPTLPNTLVDSRLLRIQ